MSLRTTAYRRFSWLIPAVTAVIILTAMATFPYATGYQLAPNPLWHLILDLWNSSEEWKHGIVVFPIAALLFYLKRCQLAAIPLKGSDWGLLWIVPSLVLYWIGFMANIQFVGYFAFQFMIAGLAIWFLGFRFFRGTFFIWCFLFFAYPFVFLEEVIAFPMRMFMSDASFHFLNWVGVHAVREGTAIISEADPVAAFVKGQRFSVDVADPCSGLHSLFALTMVSALLGILGFQKAWKICALFVVALPMAVFGNFCRILMLTFGTMAFGSDFAIGSLENPTWFHSAAGFLVYIAAVLGVIAVAWLLNGGWRKDRNAAFVGSVGGK